MYCRLLLEKLEGISPEAKFFLLKLLQRYWEEQVVSVSNKELLKSFGIYDKSVKGVLGELKEKKYLGLERRLTGAKGRPKQALSKGEALQELVRKWTIESTLINHEPSIEKVLEVTAEREQIKSSSSFINRKNTNKSVASRVLTNTRKLLLCVLLAKADQFGVIRNLGMTELASLVGLSKEQLRWHLKILKGSQFLLGYISGRSIKGTAGKMKSTFVLRLEWLGGEQSVRRVGGIHDSEALRLFERAVYIAHALVVTNGHLKRREFKEACLAQFKHWDSIYHIRKSELEDIVRSIDLLLKIEDANQLAYMRICEFVCELVTALLMIRKEDGSISVYSEQDIVKKVEEEVKRLKLNMPGARAYNLNSFIWLSRLVWMLYGEILKIIGTSNSKDRVVSCLIHPLMHSSTVLTYISTEETQSDVISPVT